MKRLKSKLDYIKTTMKLYNCDINKNVKCKKNNCVCNGGPCKMTTEFKYSKKRFIDILKRMSPL